MADQQKKPGPAKASPDFQAAQVGGEQQAQGLVGLVVPASELEGKARARPEPLQVARVKFPSPGYAVAPGESKTVMEGTWDPRTQVTTIKLPGGDQLLVHVSQALTRLKKLPGPTPDEAEAG